MDEIKCSLNLMLIDIGYVNVLKGYRFREGSLYLFTNILPILFLYLNTVTVTTGAFEP